MVSLSQNALGACDWSTIKKVDSIYHYTKECNLEVGRLVQEAEKRRQQVDKLNKSIELKDLAIDKAEQRVELWKNTSYKLEDRLIKHDKWSKRNDWILFGGGMLTAILTGWAIGQASK